MALTPSHGPTRLAVDPTSPPLLRMREIRKRFGSEIALDGVDLDVRHGEIHALLGENGAGKSTLLKILNGEVRADDGSIEIDGTRTVVHNPLAASGVGISMVHQELALLPNLSIAENLALAREPRMAPGILDRRAMHANGLRLLRLLDLDLDPAQNVGDLSIADRQAVELCRALAVDARILILDEPTAALGEQESQRLFANLRRLRARGMAIIYVSHRLREVIDLSDRSTVLRNGRTALTCPTAELDEDMLVAAMVGRRVEQLFPPRGSARDEAAVVRLRAAGFGARLHAVDVEVRPGEVVGVTGLEGAGQRELGRLVAGVVAPTTGAVEHGAAGRDRPRIALVPADRKEEGLSLDRPARENLTASIVAQIRSRLGLLSSAREAERSRRAADSAALSSPLGLETRWLSGGNQQKVLLGRAIAERPDVLVLEEPTRGVDMNARADIYTVIREVAAQGTAVLVVSTDLLEVSGLSDRVLVMRQGRIAAELAGADASEARIHQHAQIASPGGGSTHPGGGAAGTTTRPGRWRRAALRPSLVPLLVLLALVAIGTVLADDFMTVGNLQSLANRAVLLGLVAAGQLVVVLVGGVDLSVGTVVGLTNMVAADLLISSGTPLLVVVVVAIAIGAAVGVVNATLVNLGMPAFLATFAMMSLLLGVIVWRYPASIGPVPSSVTRLDDGSVLGVPVAFVVVAALLFLLAQFMRRTPLGLHIYAIGGDAVAAHQLGLRVRLIRYVAYGIAGAFFGLAGMYLVIKVGAGLPNSGSGLEYDSIAIVLIGGASLLGGRGSVATTALGVGIVTVLSNLMNLWGVDVFFQGLVKGLLIVAVGLMWVLAHRRRELELVRTIGLRR